MKDRIKCPKCGGVYISLVALDERGNSVYSCDACFRIFKVK